MKIYILYENPDWLPPLRRELDRAGLPYEESFVHTGHFDLGEEPPEGVFLNRISPSSHTRKHIESVDFTRELLVWLESHGRRVINGSAAFALEMSKVRQYEALRKAGLRTPWTIAAAGGSEVLKEAARQMSLPFITKHNRGGKGLGVQLFRSLNGFDQYVDSPEFEPPPDHITLLQEYIEPRERFITRVEIVNEEFLYAIQSDTSSGFQLCPAERCEPGDAFCPTTDASANGNSDRQNLFSLREGFDDPIIAQYIAFMSETGIDLAGIEFIEDHHGNKITYDVNGTTNYSPGVEERHGLNGWARVAEFLKREGEATVRSKIVMPD
ncbi:MAG: alpha-L-glutamate ligase [Candidatus Fraserbacteria bacterium RBG_16_55_9]|uniref:Alpha-L-glutamate ligase n=1 Tax=Fraserbacteria sp. (strain RBG_16_55_9) TaxID=1817864 RepID=A0A1F5UUV1_FRAXR|nr:MAG: alpha-L-glutamate ligase [Candidatus Fraserbacteria bacterium RBG_16_55_9]